MFICQSNLNHAQFGLLGIFFGGSRNQLDYLVNLTLTVREWTHETKYIQFGTTDGYRLLIDNETGQIYAVVDDKIPLQYVLLADDLEMFFCNLTTLYQIIAPIFPKYVDVEIPENVVKDALQQIGVKTGESFWLYQIQ
jgi:hypothetical protein